MFPSDSTVLQAPTVFLCLPHLFSKWLHNFASATVFIRLIAASIFQVVFTVCRFQRFLFCLSPYLFSEWHIVPLFCIQIKQSRVHSRKALYECKASRRLGKQMRRFYRFLSTSTYRLSQFLSKAHPAAPTLSIFLKYLLINYAVYTLSVCILANY